MARNFEVFGAPHRFVLGARVNLTNRGLFVFTRAALELLGNPEAVVYLYDRETRAVAFAPSSRAVPHAYPVRVDPNNGAGQTAAMAFCRHYGLRPERSLRCPARMEEGRLVIELGQGTPVVRRQRRATVAPAPAE